MGAPTFYNAPNSNPATYAAAVTPGTPLARAARAFWIGGAGNLSLTMEDGTTIVFNGVPVGVFPVGAALVTSANTTATNIVALF